MLEASMNKEIRVDGPTRMSESLNRGELIPLTGFSVVELEGDLFVH